MKGERDALLKLIQSLRREYEAVQSAKSGQESELRQLKDRMMLGVSGGCWSLHSGEILRHITSFHSSHRTRYTSTPPDLDCLCTKLAGPSAEALIYTCLP